ncbi:MAG TPA: phosphotransferase, partial [Nodosilinea sp.]|nr:phosphotransferase [Nodosilinea sp.]
TDLASYRVQYTLWEAGWAADSPDGVSVPEPLGVVPDWHMTLQRWVPGTPATQSLATPQGLVLAPRIAALAHKLHCTPVPTAKVHTLADELHILRQRLPLVAQQHPAWAARLDHILTRCQHRAAPFLAAPFPQALPPTGIHRDFYADQVLVDGDRLWLVDLDLYCQGSPALDLGNFIAHITEQSLRQLGDPGALADRETALREAFIALTPHRAEALGAEIELYTLLTLVRHIHISQRITSRRSYTEALMVLCEARL